MPLFDVVVDDVEELGRRKRETNEAATPDVLEMDVVLPMLTVL